MMCKLDHKMLLHVKWLDTRVGLITGFTKCLWFITTNNCNTFASHYGKHQVFYVFNSHCLIAASNNATHALTTNSDLWLLTHNYQLGWCPSYITLAQAAEKTLLPRIPLQLSDMFSRLLPSHGPGIADAEACFHCHGNVFAGRCLATCLFWVCYSNFQPSDHNVFTRLYNFYSFLSCTIVDNLFQTTSKLVPDLRIHCSRSTVLLFIFY